MRNAWRTISPGLGSALAGATSAASSGGRGGKPTGSWKVVGMFRVRSGAGLDGAEDLVRRVRLGHVALHAQHLRPHAVGLLVLAGDENDRDAFRRGVAADGACGGEA